MLGPAEQRRLAAAFGQLRRRLLDLTKPHRAINYEPQRVATLTIVDGCPAEVFRQLVDDEVTFSFAPTLPRSQAPASPPDADVHVGSRVRQRALGR